MIVTNNNPPEYVESVIKEITGKSWDEQPSVVVTVGDNLHARFDVPEYLMVHEKVHQKQQTNPEEWWEKYRDPQFRYEQELEAYRAEYQFLKKQDRNMAIQAAEEFADHLSGEMYKTKVTRYQAFLDITKK